MMQFPYSCNFIFLTAQIRECIGLGEGLGALGFRAERLRIGVIWGVCRFAQAFIQAIRLAYRLPRGTNPKPCPKL